MPSSLDSVLDSGMQIKKWIPKHNSNHFSPFSHLDTASQSRTRLFKTIFTQGNKRHRTQRKSRLKSQNTQWLAQRFHQGTRLATTNATQRKANTKQRSYSLSFPHLALLREPQSKHQGGASGNQTNAL
mmetsp:Transcript_5413/g.12063  ORF Transcript_5413/g.12063 Transcript_5413/m.12063 type:complete len:128 (-) Transcript_5413:5561-5944(-)